MAALYEKLNIVNPPTPTYFSISTNLKYNAQPFIATSNHNISSVKLALARYGDDSVPATITVEIRTDNNNKPSNTILCSGTTARETLGIRPNWEWRQINLGTGTNLTANSKYWIVIRCTNPFDNPYQWVCQYGFNDVTIDPWYFLDGKLNISSNGGSTWSAQGVDPAAKGVLFEVYSEVYSVIHIGYEKWGF